MNLRALSLFTASVASLGAAFGASAESLYVINNGSVFFNQTLYTVDSDTLAVTNVTPLAAFRPGNRTLLSIDVRPATGELFGYTSNKEIVTIDPLTGVPTTIGTASSLPDVVAPRAVSIDFNPTVDRIRFVSGTSNFRINPNDASVTTDGTLAFSAGDDNDGSRPNIVAAAYTNSVPGATTTALFDLDAQTDSLVRQNPANAGSLQTVGATGFGIADGGGFTGFDISGATAAAYLVGSSGIGGAGLTANVLYSVDLATGAATARGPITGITQGILRDIAVVEVPEPTTMAITGLAGLVLLRRRRTA